MVKLIMILKKYFSFILLIFVINSAVLTLSAEKKTNVILITLDTVRADHLACYGYKKIKTPNIDYLANKGILFKKAIASAPITLPSHTSILTGLYPFNIGVRNNGMYRLTDNANTLATVLKKNGYQTAAFVSATVLKSIFNLNQGFDLYDEKMSKQKKITGELVERDAKAVSDAALNWLKNNNKIPYFLWIHYFDAHYPYEPPDKFFKEYKGNPYDGEIAYIDSELEKLINYFKKMSKLGQDFIIVIVADHGEGLWEHGEPDHSIFLYQETIHVPLIISFFPELNKNIKINSLVRTIDIMPTILDYLSLPIPENIDGKSLLPLIEKKIPSLNEEAYSETLVPKEEFGWSPLYSLQNDQWKFILAPEAEFYNLNHDPREKINLINISNRKQQQILKTKLLSLIPKEETIQPRIPPNLTQEDLEKLSALGYLGIPNKKEETLIDPKSQKEIIKLMFQGANLFIQGKYNETIELIHKVLQKNPFNRQALMWIVQSYLALGNFNEALKYAKINLNLGDPAGILHFNLGNIYYNSGNEKEAEEYYKKAAAINPYFANPLLNLALINLKRGKIESAKEYIFKVFKLTKNNPHSYYILGSIEALSDNFESALENFKKAIEIDPNYYEAWKNIAQIFYKQNKYKEAIEAYLKSIDPNSEDADIYLKIANIYFYDIKDKEKALIYYRKTLDLSPYHPDAYMIKQIIKLIE